MVSIDGIQYQEDCTSCGSCHCEICGEAFLHGSQIAGRAIIECCIPELEEPVLKDNEKVVVLLDFWG